VTDRRRLTVALAAGGGLLVVLGALAAGLVGALVASVIALAASAFALGAPAVLPATCVAAAAVLAFAVGDARDDGGVSATPASASARASAPADGAELRAARAQLAGAVAAGEKKDAAVKAATARAAKAEALVHRYQARAHRAERALKRRAAKKHHK
jgi:hypothetical protein